MVLRSVLVLDRTYTQVKSRTFSSTNCALTVFIFMFIFMFIFFQKAVATRFAQKEPLRLGKPSESLKRRVGYFEEELCATRTKLDNMQVDEMHQEKE